MRRIPLFLLILIAACAPRAQAQVQVTLNLKRHFYMAFEPIIATVDITNLSGRDLPLADGEGHPWFGFTILKSDGMPLVPLDASYTLHPLTIPAGEKIRRSVNLNELYPIHEYGGYKVRAVVYFSPVQKFFESRPTLIEISEGKTLWQQTVGVPEGEPTAGATRKISLLKFRSVDHNELYVKIQDVNTDVVYCAAALGRLLDNTEPQILIDSRNRLHILQGIAAKTYVYSAIDPNGGIAARRMYLSDRSRPAMQRDTVGEVTVVGGILQDPTKAGGLDGTMSAPGNGVPKLSDRPVALPQE